MFLLDAPWAAQRRRLGPLFPAHHGDITRLGNAIRLLRQAGFRAYAFNAPEPETAEIEVLVRHPVHGKCPAIRIPIFPQEDQRMLDWEVTDDLVTLVINQFRPPMTARPELAQET